MLVKKTLQNQDDCLRDGTRKKRRIDYHRYHAFWRPTKYQKFLALLSENKPEKNIEWPRNGMDRLPREVSLDILSRLPITSLLRFRYVSKSWQKLSCNPHLINLHLSRSAKNSTCLIFHCCYPFGNQLHFVEFSDHNDKEMVRNIKPPYPTSMLEINVVGSCNGLICLSNSKNHDVIQVFNPFTRSCKQLSESRQFDDQMVLVGFGFHPLTNEYKVVRIVYYQNQSVNELFPRFVRGGFRHVYPQSEVQIYSLGSNDWRCIGEVPYQIESRSSESLYVNGRLHWLTRSGYGGGYPRSIISFDLANEQFIEVPAPDWAGIRTYPYPLAVLGGCLSVVIRPHHGNIEIWVMKEYGVRESWSKDFEIDVNGSVQDGPRVWATSIQSLAFQVLCQTKSGEILLKQDKVVVSYDPKSKAFKNVTFEGMPKWFHVIVHVGSLVCIENV